jgi:methionyl-tRNA synthetase
VQAAEVAGMEVQEYIDLHAKHFQELAQALHMNLTVFQQGSNTETHYPASQKLWDLCAHDIYKKEYQGLYCVGCETFYTQDELNEQGECFEHPGKELQMIQEENYFFKLSAYQEKLIEVIESGQAAIYPESRKNEVLSFIKSQLQDISISRSNERAKNWGVPVPGDDSQRMYVWFDALNIYQSGVGFGWDDDRYASTWPADCHVIGKGIIRFHAVYWLAFLLSAGLELPKSIVVHGYVTIEGQKMSKSIGNVINPMDLIEKYGAESLRYYLLSQIPTFNDGDYSEKRFEDIYNAHLAGGIGNTVSRVAAMSIKNFDGVVPESDIQDPFETQAIWKEYQEACDAYQVDKAIQVVWKYIDAINKYLEECKPWEIKDDPEALVRILKTCLEGIRQISILVRPFLPEVSDKILEVLGYDASYIQKPLDDLKVWGTIAQGNTISKVALFPRIETHESTTDQ